MSRLGTVGRCALVLAILVPMAKADEADGCGDPLPPTLRPKSTRPIELGSRARNDGSHQDHARARRADRISISTNFRLTDVVTYLKQKHDIEIQLDIKMLEEASIGIDTPVTRSLQGTHASFGVCD